MDQQRDRISNPNFPTASQNSPSYASYQPSAPQPPPQQPPFDPFTRPDQRRDPFMPASFGARRDSLNGNSRQPNNYASKDVLQPSPQLPPSPYRSGAPSSYASDRRNSLGETGLPQQSLQHPTSLLNRHMPPPSSSPNQSPAQPYSSSALRGPLPSPLPRPRDSSAPVSNHRSGGSMSIQSIMGSDAGPSSNPPTRSNPPSRSGSYTQPASPLDRRFGSKSEMENEPQPHTPASRADRPAYSSFDRSETSITSPGPGIGSQYQPAERSGPGFSRLLQSYQHTSNENNGGAPSRPFSQPAGVDPGGGPPGPVHYEGRQASGSREDYGGGTFEKVVRDRSFSDLESKKVSLLNQPYPRPAHEPFSPVSGPPQPVHAPYQPRAQDYRNPLLNGTGARRDSESNQAPQSSNLSFPGQPSSVNGIADRASFDSSARHSLDASGPSNPPYYPSHGAEHPGYGPSRYGDMHSSKTPPIDTQLRKSIEDSQRQSLSRFASEFGRRPDRSSPLPQAVQGAQSQPAGSGRDPGVKSEFGRMFSGLGSGVGSTPQPVPPPSNGAPTPTRRSPEGDGGEPEPFGRRTVQENSGFKPSGVGSRGGRRGGKRTLVENGRRDSDSGDGRSTPLTASARGAKRNRYMQQATGQHHHHHPQGPHHHHHHRKPEENSAVSLNRRASNTPYSSFRFPTPGPAPNSTTIPHHHHHHHPVPHPVPHHHHHHVPRPNTDVRVKRPVTKISTSPLLRSVSHLQRRHLGSQLYSPTIAIPGASFRTVDSPAVHQTAIEPNPLPHFDRSKVNSTFSIRVPRYYLTDMEREKICKARRVWGTDVYTDDSDPLAAAIHSGWVRGAWASDVDVSVVLGLDMVSNTPSSLTGNTNGNAEGGTSPEVTKENKTQDSGKTESSVLTAPPSGGPPVPPTDRDLHLTLLLLPPLEKYTESVWHGVKSRSWGENHDGLSFKIFKVEWVDEGLGSRWEERGGAARKRRLGLADSIISHQASRKKTLPASRVVGTMQASRTSKVAA